MIKSKLKLVDEPEIDPGQAVAEAILQAGRRTDESNKALIAAIKGIIMAPPQVQVVHHETVQPAPAAKPRPTEWTFTVVRDAQGLMTSITARAT